MSAENEALIRRGWEEMANQQNLDLIDELYASDALYHGPDGDLTGPAAIREMMSGYFTAFPDVQTTVDELVASGDEVFTRVTIRGTQTGPLGDFPPSGKPVEINLLQFVRIDNGRIAEEWEQFNMLSMLQQVGALPSEVGA